jgi:hypothetical protein
MAYPPLLEEAAVEAAADAADDAAEAAAADATMAVLPWSPSLSASPTDSMTTPDAAAPPASLAACDDAADDCEGTNVVQIEYTMGVKQKVLKQGDSIADIRHDSG